MKTHFFLFFLFVVVVLLVSIEPALAQQSARDWERPATDLIDRLSEGLVTIGVAVVGIGITVAGIIAAILGRMDWNRVIYAVIGGLFITGAATFAGLILN